MSLQQLAVALKAKRPKMSLDLAKAKSAQEVGEILADSWYGYGLKKGQSDGTTYSMVIETDPKTFTDAFKYLWLKPKGDKDGATVYRMMGMPYDILVKVDGKRHNVTVINQE